MKKNLTLSTIVLFGLFSPAIFAATYPTVTPKPSGHFYIQADAGLSYAKIGKTQESDVNGAPVRTNTFVNKSSIQHPVIGGLHAGYMFALQPKTFFGLGVGVYQSGNYKSKGRIYQQNQEKFYNYDYRYKLDAFRAMVEGKLLYATGTISPYVEAGVGYAHLRLKDFQTQPKDSSILLPMPVFGSKSTDDVAAQAGLGLQFRAAKHVNLLAGYRYVYLGEAKSGIYKNPGATGRIKTGKISTNDFVLGINFEI
ncbi:MAG: outer membrane beta-barrel protein [Gammaproteobacteria bacterium]|nr:outer membrane beta-barrel protein [Gammaproteobacteria bacterium]